MTRGGSSFCSIYIEVFMKVADYLSSAMQGGKQGLVDISPQWWK